MMTTHVASTMTARTSPWSPSRWVLGGLACALVSTLTAAASAGGPPQAGPAASTPTTLATFSLKPNGKFVQCLAQYPSDPNRQPQIDVAIVRGAQNDLLTLHGRYIKPNLQFDMFTIENDPFNADGTANPAFTNFGFAWYQSDLQANDRGEMRAAIKTILLDQIFGFDPDAPVGPTNTFEVGFWFNNPADAAACGFDVTKPTPFNGQHAAGPLAAISLPDAATGLGPLCTNPDTSVSPVRCNP